MTIKRKYDVFCSYAHADNDGGWVDSFIEKLASIYRKLTGEPLKVFMDRESIITSEVWEKKITGALEESRLLLAVLSPSFFHSKWCIKEWAYMARTETHLRERDLIPTEFGIIVPLLLHSLERGSYTRYQKRYVTAARARRWYDFSSESIGTPVRDTQVKSLAENVIDLSYELDRYLTINDPGDGSANGTVVVDMRTGLMWSGALSQESMKFDEAKRYIKGFRLGGFADWKLPTKNELETLLNPVLLETGEESSFPLYEPFNIQRYGYLHSRTLVPKPYGKGGNYVMNAKLM